MQNVSWSFPTDVRRDVVIPVGSKLLVTAPYPFRVRIQLGDRPTALLKSDRSLLLLEPAPRNADWQWNALGSEARQRITW